MLQSTRRLGELQGCLIRGLIHYSRGWHSPGTEPWQGGFPQGQQHKTGHKTRHKTIVLSPVSGAGAGSGPPRSCGLSPRETNPTTKSGA